MPNKMFPPNPCNRIHALRPNTACSIQNQVVYQQDRGSILDGDFTAKWVKIARLNTTPTAHRKNCGLGAHVKENVK